MSSSGFSFLSFFWLHHTACGILASTPGNEPRPSTVKVWSPNTGLPGNSLVLDFLYQKECEFLFYQSERKKSNRKKFLNWRVNLWRKKNRSQLPTDSNISALTRIKDYPRGGGGGRQDNKQTNILCPWTRGHVLLPCSPWPLLLTFSASNANLNGLYLGDGPKICLIQGLNRPSRPSDSSVFHLCPTNL